MGLVGVELVVGCGRLISGLSCLRDFGSFMVRIAWKSSALVGCWILLSSLSLSLLILGPASLWGVHELGSLRLPSST